ncbi:MAG: transposase [Solirubrobacterales bacterium]|nr:transposase [Solirubrobacterales bacterium]
MLDAFSRKIVGWSIDSSQTTALVTNALGMAVGERNPGVGSIIHSHKVKNAGLAPSMGSVGSAHDNAMMESFWARMQVELLNRKRWKTRIELATAIHDYIELFHNTKRRHSALNMLTPAEFETQHQSNQLAA